MAAAGDPEVLTAAGVPGAGVPAGRFGKFPGKAGYPGTGQGAAGASFFCNTVGGRNEATDSQKSPSEMKKGGPPPLLVHFFRQDLIPIR